MIKFSFADLKFFPSPKLKIVRSIGKSADDKDVYYLSAFDREICEIATNSPDSPYNVESIKPGKTIHYR